MVVKEGGEARLRDRQNALLVATLYPFDAYPQTIIQEVV